MPGADIINTIGITAYILVLFLFLWMAQIPEQDKREHHWLWAVIMILLGRLNMQFLDGYLALTHIQTIYAILLTFEKYNLIVGLLKHLQWHTHIDKSKRYGIYTAAALAALIICFNSLLGYKTAAAIIFSCSQSLALAAMAYLVYKHYQNTRIRNLLLICVVLGLYSLHWLTYPFARNIPIWLAVGFIIGNFFNIILYLFFAYLELYSFQARLLKTEQEAKAMAQKAIAGSNAKSQFLAAMSHELRTPLNGVLGMLAILKKSQLSPRQKDQADIAHQSSKKLLVIINDILDFSKIETGNLTIENVECDVYCTIQGLVDNMHTRFADKGITLNMEIDALKANRVKTDPVRLNRIITNLLNNAIKFTDSGTITLSALFKGCGDARQLHCHIQDTGIGVSEDKLSLLFEAFEQEDNSSTRKYGGTGLGLSICKNLCELMGGGITVSSVKGEGSCFSFYVSTPECSGTPSRRREN
ncbi:MAG: hypothetical protein COA42_23585 [Alteromonadaceae bacterium]|nr:MAG: hypothetical protein COA42_23585 [Alteromonadaceae bacterium]